MKEQGGMIARYLVAVTLAVGPLIAFSPTVSQATLTFDLNQEFTGGTAPSGTPPWATLQFTNAVVPGTVGLKISLHLQDPDEFVSKIWFNFTPDSNLSSLLFAPASGDAATNILKNANGNASGGGNFFDVEFQYATSNAGSGNLRFKNSDLSEYTITCPGCSSFSEASFDVFAATTGGNTAFHAAAHVQGIGPSANLSGKIGDSPPALVPEPTSLLLLGSGLLGVGLYSLRFRKRD